MVELTQKFKTMSLQNALMTPKQNWKLSVADKLAR